MSTGWRGISLPPRWGRAHSFDPRHVRLFDDRRCKLCGATLTRLEGGYWEMWGDPAGREAGTYSKIPGCAREIEIVRPAILN